CDSTGPQVDVPFALFGDGVLDGHIGQLDATARPEHAGDLGEHRVLVGDQVDHAVRDDHVEADAVEREVLGAALDDPDATESHLRDRATRLGDHLGRHVDT